MACLPDPPPRPGLTADDAEHYRRVLHGLIDQAGRIATTLHDQIVAAPPPDAPLAGPAHDLTARFERVARVAQRAILLAWAIAERRLPLAAAPAAAQQDRATLRRKLLRDVEDALICGSHHGDTGSLHVELLERLDGPDLEADLVNRPLPEIILDLKRDLGLAGRTPRRTPDHIAVLCARAAAPSRPGAAASAGLQPEPEPILPPDRSSEPGSLLSHLLAKSDEDDDDDEDEDEDEDEDDDDPFAEPSRTG